MTHHTPVTVQLAALVADFEAAGGKLNSVTPVVTLYDAHCQYALKAGQSPECLELVLLAMTLAGGRLCKLPDGTPAMYGVRAEDAGFMAMP